MQTNNLPTSMPSIEKLLARIKNAEKSNQKEIKITLAEARDLAIDLAMMTGKMSATLKSINENLQKIAGKDSDIEIKFDGGDF